MLPALVARLTGRVNKLPRDERRGSKRLVPMQITPCQLASTEAPPVGHALIHDLSPRGAGILAESGFEPGAVVSLLLVNANHTYSVSVEYEVIRCTRSPAGTFFMGGRFRRPLEHDELVPFLV
jgi:hypothetical protein